MTTKPLPPPTEQGRAIIETWNTTKSSIMINAYAGTGKTTFLQQLAPHIRERDVLLLAFNKKNAEDLKAKMPAHFECATMNSIGHRALAKALGGYLKVEADKIGNILKSLIKEQNLQLPEGRWGEIVGLVRRAKSSGLMPSVFSSYRSLLPDNEESWEMLCDLDMTSPEAETIRMARDILIASTKMAMQQKVIDYDDQIYLSVLAAGAYQQYSVVGVDEAQDLSPLNHKQLAKVLRLGGRMIAVGDPKQAIYAFRGASSKSMAEIKEIRKDSFVELPLSMTFRCSRVVVQRSLPHAPGFVAAPSNRDGTLIDLRGVGEKGWSLEDFPSSGRIGILCRNNAPLLSCAFRLIRAGRGVTMLGRDIGKNLTKLLQKICGTKEEKSVADCIEAINAWRSKESQLAIANGKESLIASIDDRADCLLAVAEGSGANNLGGIHKKLLELFEDQSGLISLGTGHRAKGMEWETVVHLDPFRLPSKFALKADDLGDPGPLEQENNLRYVIETRSIDVLVLANLKEFQP